jgi:hypothetical protein
MAFIPPSMMQDDFVDTLGESVTRQVSVFMTVFMLGYALRVNKTDADKAKRVSVKPC